MSRRLTRAQILENRAFLKALERTGNIRLAARTVGIAYGTIQHRRRAHPAFAQRTDAALAFAQAKLAGRGGGKRPRAAPPDAESRAHRTKGGEMTVIALSDGRLQMRAAQPGKLTRECEQAFLAALSATANVRLSAAAAGASARAFYRRRRSNPAFAREMRLALQRGYERIELALVASTLADAYEDDAWRHNDPPPIPPMSCNQALQLLYLHQKEARLIAEPDHIKRRRGESDEAHSLRLQAMAEASLQRQREAFEVAEALRREGRPSRFEPAPPVLPALDQVTGWSKAKPRRPIENDDDRVWAPGMPDGCDLSDTESAPEGPVYHEDVALFGGWRLKDWEERKS